MGITLKQLIDTVSQLKDYVLHKTNKIDQINIAQKTVNTELDYCYLLLSNDANVTLKTDYVLPFIKSNGNIETNENNYSVILKAGKTYKISCDVYTMKSGYTVFNIYDITNDKVISSFIKSASKYDTTASNTNTETLYKPETDCEIQVKTYQIEGTQYLEPYTYLRSYFIVEEIGRVITIDPIEYVNIAQGIEDTPVGHILTHMGNTAPKHYLICNGAEYDIIDYPVLANHILDEFGSYNYFGGDGIDTFAVPQMNFCELVPKMYTYSGDICKVTQDSEYSTSYKGFYVFDRDDTTGWLTTIAPEDGLSTYVQIQFTDNKDRIVSKISLRNLTYNSVNRCKDFELQASNDGVDFDTLLIDVLPNDSSQYYDYTIASNKTYSIFRIIIKTTHGANNYNLGLGDVRLFGSVTPYTFIKYESTYFYADNVTVQYINTDEQLEQEITQLGLILDDINGEVI